MKINKLSIAGFRGIRERLELDIPSGFMIICGRNGAGKSTLCDAIVFTITGKIRSGSDSKENRESYNNYIWWRGNGKAPQKSVSLSLIDDLGNVREISRNELLRSNAISLDYLIDSDLAPMDPFDQLVRTSIIRDEYITQFSVDLQERERFDFAKNAIGRINFDSISEKGEALLLFAKNRVSILNSEYQKQRDRVSEMTASLSEMSSSKVFN